MSNVKAFQAWTGTLMLQKFDPGSNRLPILLLPSRLILFGVFQVIIAAVIWLAGGAFGLQAAAIYWPFAAIGANCVTVILLWRVLLLEGLSLRDIYRLAKGTVGRDVVAAVVVFILAAFLAVFPNMILGNVLFGNADRVTPIMFGRMAPAVALLTIAFPITIAFAELPLYLGYIVPRLAVLTKRKVTAAVIAASFLSLQHCTLPLILDFRFILWRFGMFLPLSLLLALAFIWRPRLLPYMMIGHALLDLATVAMIVAGSFK